MQGRYESVGGSLHALFLTLTFGGLDTDLLVILLEGSEILTSLRELTFFHTLTDVPMDEGTLGVHEIELVIDSGEDLSDGSGVGDHADGAHDLGEVTTWDNSGWLVVDTALETGWAPIDELDGSLGLDGGDSGVDILGDNITSVHKAAGHVLSVSWVTFGHHGGWLEGGVGDLGNGELFVVCLLSGDDWGVGGKHEMDTWVWHQVGLELSDIDVEGTIESEGGSEGRDDLSDDSVEVGVGWALNVEVSSADIVDCLVVKHDGNIGVLKEGVGGEHRVVWLDDSGGDLWGWVDSESELRLLSVVDRESLKEEGSKTRSGTTSDGVEDKETLETSALISELSDSVEAKINDLLTNGVVTTGEVVGGVFLSGDELLWVEELSVGSGSDLIDNGWLKIEENGSWDLLASTSLGEEGVESIVSATDGLVRWHLTVWLDSVLKAEELPASVTDLDTGLTNVD